VTRLPLRLPLAGALALASFAWAQPASLPTIATIPGMPPVVEATNLYSETAAGKLAASTAGHLARVYVPHVRSNDVYVIDPATLKVVDKFKVGKSPQHVVPSWDLQTLWVANNAERTPNGSLTRIDPTTGKPVETIPVDDPYNMYFSPDGKHAIVVAEAFKRLDFRDPKTFKLDFSMTIPRCAGINHADWSIDGRYAIFTCEFAGGIVKVDMVERKVLGFLQLIAPGKPTKVVKGPDGRDETICTTWKGMPQDVRTSPDGKTFYIADMMSHGVYVVDLESFRQVGFIPTGMGAHGLYPSRDGKLLYIANRGTTKIHGPPKGPGKVSVMNFATRKIVAEWPVPGGGSPDMGNVSADGKQLWLSGRYDDAVYVFDTATGAAKTIKVGMEPHGLAVWPQPGRYSLGHTGNMR
jgi:YVTN family beta-propeller protein